MSRTITVAPVRKSVHVKADAARAFEVFTAGMSRWWPATHSILKVAPKEHVLEPRVGGRWYQVGVDGSVCENGKVLVFEPPHRLVLAWQINAFPLSPRSFKVLWCANHLGLDYEFKLVDFTKSAQNAPDYLTINPNGRAPAIEHDGFVLWESNAIVEYFASLKPEAGLLPQDTRGRVPIAKWLFWESAHWDPACAIFAFERVVKP